MGTLAAIAGDVEDPVDSGSGCSGMVPDFHGSLLLLLFNLLDSPCLGGNLHDGTADAVQEMVLVRDSVPECIRLRGMPYGIPDRYFRTWRRIYVWNCSRVRVPDRAASVLLFRPDPYKNQKVYAKRSVQNV